jgi:hypothetical protein
MIHRVYPKGLHNSRLSTTDCEPTSRWSSQSALGGAKLRSRLTRTRALPGPVFPTASVLARFNAVNFSTAYLRQSTRQGSTQVEVLSAPFCCLTSCFPFSPYLAVTCYSNHNFLIASFCLFESLSARVVTVTGCPPLLYLQVLASFPFDLFLPESYLPLRLLQHVLHFPSNLDFVHCLGIQVVRVCLPAGVSGSSFL